MRIELTRRQAEELVKHLQESQIGHDWPSAEVLSDIAKKVRQKLKAIQE
jgi:hypothetical protein